MIDSGIPAKDEWPLGVLDKLRAWEQGDLVEAPPLFYYADPAKPVWNLTTFYTADSPGPEVIIAEDRPPFGIVTTQTCDIAEEDRKNPKRPWIHVAPVYEVASGVQRQIEHGHGPMYWWLIPNMPNPGVWIADLRIEVPIEKGWLAGQRRLEGFVDASNKRRFGQRLAWLKSRPAFSRAFVEVVQAKVFDFLDGHPELVSELDELAVQVDSYLRPTIVQILFLTETPLVKDFRELVEAWWDLARGQANQADILLLAPDFREITKLSVAEYRGMSSIWTR